MDPGNKAIRHTYYMRVRLRRCYPLGWVHHPPPDSPLHHTPTLWYRWKSSHSWSLVAKNSFDGRFERIALWRPVARPWSTTRKLAHTG